MAVYMQSYFFSPKSRRYVHLDFPGDIFIDWKMGQIYNLIVTEENITDRR